ncbi:hypothetical protein MRX96_005182 [Rhipicephalus microplus]
MIPCEESTTLSSGDALRSMGDAELPQGENTDAMNPTNILAASDPMMTKHCGSGPLVFLFARSSWMASCYGKQKCQHHGENSQSMQ